MSVGTALGQEYEAPDSGHPLPLAMMAGRTCRLCVKPEL